MLNNPQVSPGGLEYSVRRAFIDEFYMRQASSLKAGSRVLDLGGKRSPKRGQFRIEHYDVRVRYANLSAANRPDVQTDAAMLPFKNETFDAVICAEMLEHVADPVSVIRETYRVLRERGVLLMTVPFLFPIHADPYDYCRYTDHYWRENLQKAGFVDLAVESQGYFWSVAVDMARAWCYERVKQGRLQSRLVQRVIGALVARGKRIAFSREQRVEACDHAFVTRYTTGYGIRVVRP
ncbi:MAG TPA: methyltransferase domain-containing protein [Nitrospira sp.]|nr:methyltransferase domain-containing protein [Nitrospira sp.]